MPWRTLQPKKQDHPSDAQIKRLYTIASNNGWSHDRVKLLLSITHHKQSTKDLTMEEYGEVCEYLESNVQRGEKE